MRAHALRRHLFGRLDLEAERVAVERQRRREIRDRDADVIENRLSCRASRSSSRPSAPVRLGRDAARVQRSAAVYGSISRAAMRSTIAPSSPGAEHVAFEMCHEPLRHAARAAGTRCASRRRAACVARGVRAEPRRSPSTSSATPSPVVATVLHDRRPPLARRRRSAATAFASIAATSRSAPSRSALLTTKMSAISMMPALSACTSSPVPGTSVDDRDVGGADDVDFVLADADGFDDDDVLAGGVEHERGVAGRAREAAEMAARRHAADEHAVVGGVRLHAQAIAEDRAAA